FARVAIGHAVVCAESRGYMLVARPPRVVDERDSRIAARHDLVDLHVLQLLVPDRDALRDGVGVLGGLTGVVGDRDLRRSDGRGRGRWRDRDQRQQQDRKSTRLNSSHVKISYAVFCLKKKRPQKNTTKRGT